jgi:hypothetical protein
LLVHHRIANDQTFPLTAVLVIVANGKPRRDQHSPIGHAKFRSRSDAAVICVYDEAGNVIETHEHKGDFERAAKRRVVMNSHASTP